ncbi:MAG: response regulator [Gemmatimonadetes bacterium]|nr:response regulator [Gemmatimonadota bacterium]
MAVILVVDDDENNRDVYRVILEYRGHTCHEGDDGMSALDSAVALVPDLILMDIEMPLMAGWTATSLLKSNPATSRVPVVALTATGWDSDAARAYRAGFDRYIRNQPGPPT